jgi:VCBS repeat-containing protein
VFNGEYNSLTGFSVSGAGDVNGDGIDDLIIGAPLAYGSTTASYGYGGEAYVVFGSAAGFGASFELSSLAAGDGSTGFAVLGQNSDYAGTAVSSAGDINGDGIDDLIVGALYANGDAAYSGGAYVVFGTNAGFGPTLEVSALNGADGFAILGIQAYDYSGRSVSGAGDVNGDGIDDLIVGSYAYGSNGPYSGQAYVVFGSNTTPFAAELDLSGLNGANGFAINGVDAYDRAGFAVSGAGDINGDGFNDLIVGAPGQYGYGGTSYVVFGSAAGFGGAFELSTLLAANGGDGSTGFEISGGSLFDFSGFSVSGAGDVNGDGIDDLVIGAPGTSAFAGAAYVVFGSTAGFGANLDLSVFAAGNGDAGFVLNGIDGGGRGGKGGDFSGFSVSGAGDVNGDGADDLIVGAYGGNPNGGNSGESYIIFGLNPGETFVASVADDLAGVETPGNGSAVAPVIGDVIANDPLGVEVSAVNGDAAGVGGTTTGGFGVLAMAADGEFSYQINSTQAEVLALDGNEFLLDQFAYTATDDNGDPSTADLSIIISEANIVLGSNSDDAAVNGTAGDDVTLGGGGGDELNGNGGSDRFVILNTDDKGTDTVTDFDGNDTLDVSNLIDFGGGEATGVIAFLDTGDDTAVIDNSADGGGFTVAVIDDVNPGDLSIDANGAIAITLIP